MRGPRVSAVMLALCVLAAGCGTAPAAGRISYRVPGEYNLAFKAHAVKIADPAMDRRCYYRVFIDKVEAGRTSTGLESQFVSFETKLPENRHLLEVEKWVLNARDRRYVKLNRIDQPRPNFFYFEVPEKRVVVITLVCDAESGRSIFGMEHERD